jgi:hypothetical protein
MRLPEDLAILFERAERVAANTRRLVAENDRLRRRAERQLDAMFELSAEFRSPPPPLPRLDLLP